MAPPADNSCQAGVRLRVPWRRHCLGPDRGYTNAQQENPLINAGRILRDHRESRGLSLRDLARETRITIPVLEAIERGWSDRLPEHAYLNSMLALLEQYLDMPCGCLSEALPERSRQQVTCEKIISRRPKLDAIEVFATWRGNVVYGIVMLTTLYGLNQQQRQLAASNTLSLYPIPLTADQLRDKVTYPLVGKNTSLHKIVSLYDDHHQQLEQWERSVGSSGKSDSTNTKLLQLTLQEPRQLRISSARGDRTNLENAQGNLRFQLQGPLELTIRPPLNDNDYLIWDGYEPSALAGRPGDYWLGQPGETRLRAADRERPQTSLRSP